MRTGISRRRVLAGAAAIGAAGILPIGRARAAGGTLTFGMTPYPPNTKPFENVGNAANAVKTLIYRGLMAYDPTGKLIPELAEKVTLESPTVYRFDLRSNAKFHNGQPVTSEDVKFTFETMAKNDSTAFLRAEMRQIESIETPDPKTVRITLKEPSAVFLNLVASYHAPVISKASDANNAVGCGPYKIVASERGQSITVERVPDFYKKGLPKAQTVKFVNYQDQDLRVAALRTGEADIIHSVPWENIDALKKEKGIVLDSVNDGAFFYLNFNCKTGPFADKRLRQMVAFAINRQEVVEAVCFGHGRTMEGLPIPGGNPFGDSKALNTFSYDPDKAKALLKEAGFAPGALTVNMLVSPTSGGHLPCAEIVQQNLSKIGVKVDMTMAEWGKRLQMGIAGQYEFSVFGTQSISNDPDGISQFIGTASPNHSRSYLFSSAKIDGLLAAGRRELDLEKRVQIYDEIHRECASEVPFCGLAWRTQPYGMNAKLRGFKNMPAFLWSYSPMTMEEAELVG